ncbi:DUF4352 domain-containing protein [Enterococcus avium]|uniref:DUF4352 domain-containing protein n=1 Tax=Enterococcus avium TaxID=33945 RepID=UPI0032E43A75
MKKVYLGLALSLFVFGLTACGSNNESAVEESSSSNNFDAAFEQAKNQVSEEENPTPDPDIEDVSEKDSESSESVSASVGQSQPLSSESGDIIDVKIDSVEKDTGDGDYYVPENGYYAKVNFTVTNLGDSPFDVNAHQLEFYDGNNMKAELNSRDFYSDTIQPGKSAQGTAYFDIKNDTPNFEVFFANASWTGNY